MIDFIRGDDFINKLMTNTLNQQAKAIRNLLPLFIQIGFVHSLNGQRA